VTIAHSTVSLLFNEYDGYLYRATSSSNTLQRIAPGVGSALPSLVNSLGSSSNFRKMLLDHNGTVLYAAGQSGNVQKFNIGNPAVAPVSVNYTGAGGDNIYDMWQDPVTNLLHVVDVLGMTTLDPGALPTDPILGVRLARPRISGETRFATITGNGADGTVTVGAISSPGKLVKLAIHSGLESPAPMSVGYFGNSETSIGGGVVDEATGLLYTANGGSIITWDITGNGDPTMVARYIVPEELISASYIAGDPSTGYLYAGHVDYTPVQAPRVHKFRLPADPRDGLQHVATSVFDSLGSDSPLGSFSYEPVTGMLYFTVVYGTRLVKVNTGVGDAAPVLVGSMLVDPGNSIASIVFSGDGRHALVALPASTTRVGKVDLGIGDSQPTLIGTYTIAATSIGLSNAAVDKATGNAWFVSSGGTQIHRLGFGTGNTPEYFGNFFYTDDARNRSIYRLAYDDRENQLFGFLARSGFPLGVARIDAATSSTTMSVLGRLDISGNTTSLNSSGLLIDGTRDRLVRLSQNSLPVPFELVALNGPSGNMELLGTASGVWRDNDILMRLPLHDTQRGSALYVRNGIKIVKMRLPSGWDAPYKASEVSLSFGTANFAAAAYDETTGHAYYTLNPSSDSVPSQIMKVAMGDGDTPPTVLGIIDLGVGERVARAIRLDPQNGYMYVVCNPIPSQNGKLVKLSMGVGDALPVRIGVVNLPYDSSTDILFDPAGYLTVYFASNPNHLVKYRAGEGDALPTLIGQVSFPAGNHIRDRITHNLLNNEAYFFVSASGTKVQLGTGEELPTFLGTFSIANGAFTGMTIDNLRNRMWFRYDNGGGGTSTQTLGYLNIGDGATLPTAGPISSVYPVAPAIVNQSLLVDAAQGVAYTSHSASPSYLVKTRMGEQHVIKGTRVTFPAMADVSALQVYSHEGVGSYRLAVYTAATPPALVWEGQPTTNTTTAGWINVPIATGSPSALQLPAGDYFLCWHTDTDAKVFSMALGLRGTGIALNHPFGTLPPTLNGAALASQSWAINATYTPIHPEASHAPSGLAFGARHVDDGPSAPLSVTVTNNGAAPLAISSISLSGAHAGDFVLQTTGTLAIAPGLSGDIAVTFDPSAAGYRSAQLTLLTNDPANPSILVGLTGTGTSDSQPEPHRVLVEVPGEPGTFIQFLSPVGTTLVNVSVDTTTVPAGLTDVLFPFGLFSFELHGLTAGGSATVTVELPRLEPISTYYKFGSQAGNPTDHWYPFETLAGTGASISGTTLTLQFIDGGRGDDDLTANGVVVDPGGPAIVLNRVDGWKELDH
jgi:hypothetical protein